MIAHKAIDIMNIAPKPMILLEKIPLELLFAIKLALRLFLLVVHDE